MSINRVLVTITDNISASSMPFNEFVLYRKNHCKNEKQVVILLFKDEPKNDVTVPSDLELHCIGKDWSKLKQTIKSIANYAKKEKAKLVFHIHEAKSVVIFNLITHFKYKNQIIYTLHSTYKNYPFHNKALVRMASIQCAFVICVSKTSLKYFPNDLRAIRKNRIQFIQNGVDSDRIYSIIDGLKDTSDADEDLISLIYVARFRTSKRHDMLLNAIKDVPNVKLRLVGTGILENEIKELAKKLGVQNKVVFCGALPRDDVFRELFTSDIYISTSSYEGLPIGVLEAMQCGLPCILSRIEQHEEIAEGCSSVTFFERTHDLTQAIRMAVSKGKAMLKAEGEKNKYDVNRNFSLDSMHQKYEQKYSSVER